ncbi:acyltransferase [Janthinobacterium sp. RB2P8]|uniref:acyltransferase n=1 Tax=Janthinobacterium sp. RB2P8 TaxID=3424191 RepID=UPI003F1F7404
MKKIINKMIAWLATSWLGKWSYRISSLAGVLILRACSLAKSATLFPGAGNLSLDIRTDLKYPENITIGSNVTIGADCQIGAMAPVVLGNYVRISRGVTIETATLDLSAALPYPHIAKPISIGNGVWLAAHVTVLGGVNIGDGAIIGAGAVISRDVPAGAIIVGSATRELKRKLEIVEEWKS